jgi:hypothetical protein
VIRALAKPALLGVPFGALMAYFDSLDNSVGHAIVVGLVIAGGITFGFAAYSVWKQRRFDAWAAKLAAPYKAEGIVQHCYAVAGETGNALQIVGVLAVGAIAARFDAGGVLILTGQRLLFVPHSPNTFTTRLDVPLTDILGVGPGYGFSGRSIRIATRANVTLHFKVDDYAKWSAALPGAKLAAPSAPATQPPSQS